MFYKDWEPIFEKIAEDFNYKLEDDMKSAKFLNKKLQDKKTFSINKLEELVKKKIIVVFGAGPSLESSILKYKKDFSDKILIAADGSTSALLENDILPDIIVTDLDGKISDQIKANSEGSLTIIHAHGNNFARIKKHINDFNGDILGTTQINPEPFNKLFNFGGFTDGDRAIYLADHFHAKKICLIGFDYNGEIGKYAFSEYKNKYMKLKKLKWCKYLIELILKNNQNIQYF
jgi:uncharacterized Rossmann fold enzyme